MTRAEQIRASVLRRAVGQFHRPTGLGGLVSGLIMSTRRSNVLRNRWVVGLLDLSEDARVLELGCGPGVALAAAADRLRGGSAVGVDHSAQVLRFARLRNRSAVAAGRVRLVRGAVEELLREDASSGATADLGGPFDAVLAVNTVGFWPEPEQRLRVLRSWMKPSGRIALVSQPRTPGATTRTAGAELRALLESAGYTDVEVHSLELDPPVVAVLATPGMDAS